MDASIFTHQPSLSRPSPFLMPWRHDHSLAGCNQPGGLCRRPPLITPLSTSPSGIPAGPGFAVVRFPAGDFPRSSGHLFGPLPSNNRSILNKKSKLPTTSLRDSLSTACRMSLRAVQNHSPHVGQANGTITTSTTANGRLVDPLNSLKNRPKTQNQPSSPIIGKKRRN